MLRESLAADLIVELPNAVRLQRLVQTLREYFNSGAVGLLRLDEDSLRPVATVGLVHEALGRRFVIAQHPRLAAIMASRPRPSTRVRVRPGAGWRPQGLVSMPRK